MMKKSLVRLAVLHAAALAATAQNAHAEAGVISLKPKAENDDALTLKPHLAEEEHVWLKPIITHEMVAGTQPMLNARKPRVQANKKPRYDKRPIHIGGGCSDHGGGSGGIDTQWPDTGKVKRSIPDGDGIQRMTAIPTLWRSAQFGQQHMGAH